MQKLILIVNFLVSIVYAQTSPRPVALFLDCNIGTHYSNSIQSTMKKRGEELIVIPCKDFQKTMDKLSTQNVYIKTMFASGHDGNGQVFSDPEREDAKGEFDPVADVAEVNKKYPEMFSHIQTYYPLGCYTTSMNNINQYMQVMPNLKLVSGFFGSAHSAHREKCQKSLIDILEKEDAIVNAGSLEEFQKVTDGLKGLKTDLNMGMYRNLACGSNELKGYTLEVDHEAESPIHRTVLFDKDECKKKKDEFRKKTAEYFKYSEGHIDVPMDTQKGPVRELYSFFRQNEHCATVVKDDKEFQNFPSAEEVFGLLFHRNYQRNFKAFYQKKMNELKNHLQQALAAKNLPQDTRTKISQALEKIKALSEQDLGSWNVQKVLNVSVGLQKSSLEFQKLNLCSNKSNCPKDELTNVANKFTQLIAERLGPDQWHAYAAGRTPVDPDEVQIIE